MCVPVKVYVTAATGLSVCVCACVCACVCVPVKVYVTAATGLSVKPLVFEVQMARTCTCVSPLPPIICVCVYVCASRSLYRRAGCIEERGLSGGVRAVEGVVYGGVLGVALEQDFARVRELSGDKPDGERERERDR